VAGSFFWGGMPVWVAVTAITMLGLVLVGLAVLMGRLKVDDALARIGGLLLILAFAPCIALLMNAALAVLLKPILLLFLLIVVVTVFVRVVVSLF
jgi:hypothetical protein